MKYTPGQREKFAKEGAGKTVASLEYDDDPSGGYWSMLFTDGTEISFRLMAEIAGDGTLDLGCLTAGPGLGINGGRVPGGWSITGRRGGFLGVGSGGLALPSGSVVRATDDGFRIEGPGYCGNGV
jgi:hypothetical protein